MTAPATASNLLELRQKIIAWRKAGDTIGLIPTMGALHAGHLSLVRLAQQVVKRTIVSIFVNPRQFGPKEDFHRYPRPLEQDLQLLAQVGADLAFTPSVEIMYPEGYSTTISVGGLSATLDGINRPGHFDGVATIVTKLLLQAFPDIAVFGEKDYQQLQIIRQLVNDLDIPTRIIGVPIMREPDGLAMSSRNRYLSEEERKIAARLYATLDETAKKIRQGNDIKKAIKEGIASLKQAGFNKIDYLELVDAQNLKPLTQWDRPARLLTASYLGTTRLIDNIPLVP